MIENPSTEKVILKNIDRELTYLTRELEKSNNDNNISLYYQILALIKITEDNL